MQKGESPDFRSPEVGIPAKGVVAYWSFNCISNSQTNHLGIG